MLDRQNWLTCLDNILPAEEIISVAKLGRWHPEWQRLSKLSYPDRLTLYALSQETELKVAMQRGGITTGMRVLDMCCGPGAISRFLLDLGVAEVIGVDRNEQILQLAEKLPIKRGQEKQLSFLQVDITKRLPFRDNYFDAVWLSNGFAGAYLPNALDEIQRITSPGGQIVFKVGNQVPPVTYAWDTALDSRINVIRYDAHRNSISGAYAAHFNSTYFELFHQARLALKMNLSNVLLERVVPVPSIFEESLRQDFALWLGPLIMEKGNYEDWEKLLLFYNPSSPEYLFNRQDAYFMQVLTIAHGETNK